MNEALRDWVANVHDTFYIIGTAAGPHPYPELVRDFQSVIGREAKIDRERVVARMIAVAKIERHGWARRKFPVLAIAAALAVALGATLFRSKHIASTAHSVVITAVAGDVTWQDSKALGIAPGQSATVDALGNLVTAPSGQAHLVTDNGLELDVFGDTRISLAEMRGPSGAVRLFRGRQGSVPRSPPCLKETFSVVASDVRVLVHGTVFSVEVAPGGEPRAITVRVAEELCSFIIGPATSRSRTRSRGRIKRLPIQEPCPPSRQTPKHRRIRPRKSRQRRRSHDEPEGRLGQSAGPWTKKRDSCVRVSPPKEAAILPMPLLHSSNCCRTFPYRLSSPTRAPRSGVSDRARNTHRDPRAHRSVRPGRGRLRDEHDFGRLLQRGQRQHPAGRSTAGW